MADQRLRRNQLLMLLKKRTFIDDNELYEMMRSRQVYHVQTELRKALDKTIRTIEHAEKLKMASFVTQRTLFLKWVQRRENGRKCVTDVELAMGAIKHNHPHGNSDLLKISGESPRHPGLYGASLLKSQEIKDDSNQHSHEERQAGHDKLSTRTNMVAEEEWLASSVNQEWMGEISETFHKERTKKSEKAERKSAKEMPDETPVSATKRQSPSVKSPKGSANSALINEYLEDEGQSRETICRRSKSPSYLNHKASNLGKSDLKDKNNSGEVNGAGKESCSNKDMAELPVGFRRILYGCQGKHNTHSNHKAPERSKLNVEIRDAINKTEGGIAEEKIMPTVISNCGGKVTRKQFSTPVFYSNGRVRTEQGLLNSMLNMDEDEYRNTQLKPKPVSADKILFTPAGAGDSYTYKSKEKQTNPRRFNQRSLAAPELPRLMKSQRHVVATSQPDLQLHTSPSNLERTVTMVYVEDQDINLDRPSSQFDFEAWCVYNRQKRGHTQVLNETHLVGHGASDPTVTVGSSESQRKRQSSLRFSSVSTNPGKTAQHFRGKRKEWYLNLLPPRKSGGQPRNIVLVGKCNQPRTHFRSRRSLLSRIDLNTKEITAGRGHQPENNRHGMLSVSDHRIAQRETTDQKLQKLRDHSKVLQSRVQNFVSSSQTMS